MVVMGPSRPLEAQGQVRLAARINSSKLPSPSEVVSRMLVRILQVAPLVSTASRVGNVMPLPGR